MIKYLLRLDDACPEMDKNKWDKVFDILEKHKITPLIGIIPSNEDSQTRITNADIHFWDRMKLFQDKGWDFALHGYNHCCDMTSGGINPVHMCSEFAGLNYEDQYSKIKKGYSILASHGINPKFFFAPCHTFDQNTINALKECTPIKYISDTFALKPYKEDGIVYIPQQMGRFRNIRISGHWTFCFHPNEMTDQDIIYFEDFIKVHKNKFISFESLTLQDWGKKTLIDKALRALYFLKRKLS